MPSSKSDPLLVQLGSHRWLVPLLADLAARKGARFVELVHRLGLSRDSLTRTLEAAQAIGWVRRNPGQFSHLFGMQQVRAALEQGGLVVRQSAETSWKILESSPSAYSPTLSG